MKIGSYRFQVDGFDVEVKDEAAAKLIQHLIFCLNKERQIIGLLLKLAGDKP